MKQHTTLFISVLCALSFIATSCQPTPPDGPQTSDAPFYLTVSMPTTNMTDVSITSGAESNTNGRTLNWLNGDQITINGIISRPVKFMGVATLRALFEFDDVPTAPYHLLHPASSYIDATRMAFPATQLNNEGMPVAALFDEVTDVVETYHLAAMLRLPLRRSAASDADTHKIAYIEFRGNNSEQVSGIFEIDYAVPSISGCDTSAEAQSIVVKLDSALSTDQATDIFIAIPAIDYSKGFSLRIVDENNHYMDIAIERAQLVNVGRVYTLSECEFVPTGTLIGVDIPQ